MQCLFTENTKTAEMFTTDGQKRGFVMVNEKKVTIPAGELVKLFSKQYDKVTGILQCCEIMEQEGTRSGAPGVIKDLATELQDEIKDLLYQFDDPDIKQEAHVIAPEPEGETP